MSLKIIVQQCCIFADSLPSLRNCLFSVRKLLPHIVHFFLLLSLTFVFPVKYWHSCLDWEEGHEAHEVFTEGAQLTHDQDDCDLCDLVFSLVSPTRPITLLVPRPTANWEQLLDYSFPSPLSPTYFLLRAPPAPLFS